MAVAYAAHGGISAAAAQTLNVAYPAGIAAGDGLVLTRAAKSETTAFVTPSGWTLLDDRTGGTGVLGNDTGQVRLARYWREADGTETGTLTVDTSPGTVDVQQGLISRYTKSAGTTWSVAASGGSDSTTGTDWSVTAATDPGITSGDLVEVVLSWPTDAARTWSAETLTATGVTLTGANIPAATGTTSLGADMAVRAHVYSCTTGTSTTPPVYTATVNSGTNIAGATSMVRLREVGGAPTITAGTVSVTAQPVTATPGPVTAELTPAATAIAATSVTATPGQVTTPLTAPTVPLTGVPVDAQPIPVVVALTPAAVLLAGLTVVDVSAVPAARGMVRVSARPQARTPARSEVRIR